MKKVYAVKRGRQTGIFNTWADCKAQVEGFNNPRFKGFTDIKEALAWLNGNDTAQNVLQTVYQNSEQADYIIYTDGSCLRNPDGPGGWAAVIMDKDAKKIAELHAGNPSTTNNRMELTAALKALEFIRAGAIIDLYTDSQYLKNAFTKNWLTNWKKRGWLTASGEPVKNQDLWQALDAAFAKVKVRFHWVKGHVGIEHNERCDMLAKAEAMQYQ